MHEKSKFVRGVVIGFGKERLIEWIGNDNEKDGNFVFVGS